MPGRYGWGQGGGSNGTPPAAVPGARTVSWLGLQSASQPRLSYAEMAEDYPRYPDIHDLDLTLLNPRMIVVRKAAALRRLCCPCPILVRAELAAGNSCCLCSAGRHPIHEPFTLHRLTQHPRLPSVQPVQNDGPAAPAGGERGGRGESEFRRPRWSIHPPSGTTAAIRESGLRSSRTRQSPSGGSLRLTPLQLSHQECGGRVGGWGLARLHEPFPLPPAFLTCCLLRGQQMLPVAQWSSFLHPRKA